MSPFVERGRRRRKRTPNRGRESSGRECLTRREPVDRSNSSTATRVRPESTERLPRPLQRTRGVDLLRSPGCGIQPADGDAASTWRASRSPRSVRQSVGIAGRGHAAHGRCRPTGDAARSDAFVRVPETDSTDREATANAHGASSNGVTGDGTSRVDPGRTRRDRRRCPSRSSIRGSAHGDYHPGNVLAADDGTIERVIDWGVQRARSQPCCRSRLLHPEAR